MKAIEVFGIVVRTVGLLVCLGSGAVLYWALINLLFGGPSNVLGLAIVGIPQLLVGLWLLRGAPLVMAYAFPDATPRLSGPQAAANHPA